MRIAAAGLVFLCAAGCDRPAQHVYSSPPPARAMPSGATPAVSVAPEFPFGSVGPAAKLVAITDAATGVPVALGSIADSLDVLTLVAFGPAEWTAREGGRVELAVRGPSFDTTFVRPLGAPAPTVAAITFRLAGLRVGRYHAAVRLRLTGGRVLAESIPTALEVVAR